MLKTEFLVTLTVTIKVAAMMAGFVLFTDGGSLMADIIGPPPVNPARRVNPGAEQTMKPLEADSAKQIEEEAMKRIEEIRGNPEKPTAASRSNLPSAEKGSFSLVTDPAIALTIAAGSGLAIAIGSLVFLKRKSRKTE